MTVVIELNVNNTCLPNWTLSCIRYIDAQRFRLPDRFIPSLIVDLWSAVKAGDLKRAMAVQAVITPLKDAVYGAGEPTGEAHARMKAGMVLAGVLDQGTVRPPTAAPDAHELEALRAAVAHAGLPARHEIRQPALQR